MEADTGRVQEVKSGHGMLLEDGKGKGRREQPLASASERIGVTGRKAYEPN